MYEMGKYFIEYQNTYGAYALSTFGVAVNESYFGTSSIALSKNNVRHSYSRLYCYSYSFAAYQPLEHLNNKAGVHSK